MEKIPGKGDLKYFLSWNSKLILLKKKSKKKPKVKTRGKKNSENWAAPYIVTCIMYFQ